MRITIVISAEKLEAQQFNESPVLQFFAERLYYCPGSAVNLQELYSHFQSWCPIDARKYWHYNRFVKNIPDKAVFCNTESEAVNGIVKGKYRGPFYHIANVALSPDEVSSTPLIRFYDKLVTEDNL